MTRHVRTLMALAGVCILAASTADAQTQVRITVTNLSPVNGTALTPMWLGVHDGAFRVFTPGQAASTGLERLAEDGNTAVLADEFTTAGFNTQTTLPGPSGVFLPGESASFTFMLDPMNSMHRYLSYASMVLPSNDAFIGSSDPTARDLTDGAGNFRNFSFTVLGGSVWDAGTEVNDELEANTAFFGQMTPNTGVTENGVTRIHDGFIQGGRILSAPQFASADFKAPGYEVVRFTVAVVPEPSTWAMMLTGLLVVGVIARRKALSA